MVAIITDEMLDVREVMPLALAAVTAALEARAAGALVSPPRHHASFGSHGDLVFTIGGTTGDDPLAGFRVYDTFGDENAAQVVAVWSPRQRRLQGIFIGTKLGEIRTGAIGGIAIRHMPAPDAESVGIIGSGRQARSQIEAAAAVRPIREVRVFSPNAERRTAFAVEMGERLALAIEPVATAQAAVADADIVICATSSTTPVIDAQWLSPGVHVNTVGPKTVAAHELGTDVASLAAIIATDSPEQTRAYRSAFFLDGMTDGRPLVDLADILAGRIPARPHGGETTLFCSTGLAGTEVLVAAKLLEMLS